MKKLTDDERYMKEAIRLAKKAYAIREVPIGCVIVYDGKIIGRGYNKRTSLGNVLAHGEILEKGAHQALMERGGAYAALYAYQFRPEDLV